MPRREMKFEVGHFYHIYNRGKDKKSIFFYERDYLHFLELWQKYLSSYSLSVIAYCLMPNHFHILLRIYAESDVSRFMSIVLNSYAKWLNTKYNRSGPLFSERFKAVHVDDPNFLLHLCRYIHLNPFTAKLVRRIELWRYSNYLEFIDKRNGRLFDKTFRDESVSYTHLTLPTKVSV